MDTLWKIALRNVWRHKRRTLITAVVMMVGIGVYIAYDSVIAGMDRLTIDTLVHYSASYLKVRTPAYAADEAGLPLDHGIPEPAKAAADLLARVPGLTAVAPRTLFLGEASNYEDSEPLVGAAVDAAADPKVFDLAANLGSGSWFPKAGTGAKEAVISAGLAKDLKLQVGDVLLLSARTAYDNDNADEFTVVGIGDQGLTLTANLYLDYGDARTFLGAALPVTELDAAAPRAASLEAELAGSEAAAKAATAAFPSLEAQSVPEAARDYLALRNSKEKGTFMIVLIILIIAAVGIVNTILMSVYARVREIGVLRAYGMEPRDVKKLFVREGLLIGLVGSLAGLALGALLVGLMAKGISIGSLFKGMDLGAYPANGILYAEWRPRTFVVGLAFGLIAAWLAARSPAKKAARLEPTDALKFV